MMEDTPAGKPRGRLLGSSTEESRLDREGVGMFQAEAGPALRPGGTES